MAGSNIQHNTLEDIIKKSNSKNLNEDGFVLLFKDLFGTTARNKLPNDFDDWTVKKQCGWIIQNMATFFPNVPQSLLSFIPALFCELAYDRSPEELPEWMDMDKYRRGQKFVHKHFTAIIISNILGLMYVFSFEEEVRPFILAGTVHTPYLGFQRYLSTLKKTISWYYGDPWIKGTQAYKDMQVTRKMHLAIRREVCQKDHEQIAAACTFANPWSLDRQLLLKDFAEVCSSEKFEKRPYTIMRKSPYKPKGINNADFAIVQSGMLVITLLFPQNIGMYDVTDEELEAFCHMWKCYGYFLGIEDEYNFCRGSIKEVKQHASDIYQYWIMQNFKEVAPEWEHIARCLVVPFNYYPLVYMPFKVMTLVSTDALNLNMPHLYASLNYTEWITYKIYRFIFYILKFSSTRAIVNNITRRIINKAANFNSKKLAEVHENSKKIIPDFSIKY